MAVTTAAVVGIATGVASTAKSFSDAAKAKKAQQKASEDAARLMSDARKRAEKNEFEGLTVPTDAYEAAFETTLAANKQQVEALQEGDARALAAGVGRAGAAAQAGAEKTRIAMGQDLFNVQKMKAQSRENIKQQLIGMDVGAAKDAKAEAAYQEQLRAQNIQQGIKGIGQVAGQIGSNAALFSKKDATAAIGSIGDNIVSANEPLMSNDFNTQAGNFAGSSNYNPTEQTSFLFDDALLELGLGGGGSPTG